MELAVYLIHWQCKRHVCVHLFAEVSKAEEMEDGEEEYHRSRWIFSTRMTDAMKAFDVSNILFHSILMQSLSS